MHKNKKKAAAPKGAAKKQTIRADSIRCIAGLQENRLSSLAAILSTIPGNDSAAQRHRLMAAMRETGHITTFEAMRMLDCYDPRPRILELRREHAIVTHMRPYATESGKTHRVGVYSLQVDARGAA